MLDLVLYLDAQPAPRRKTARINPLDLAPLNALEKDALYELHRRGLRGETMAQVTQELVNRLSRSLAAYQNAYPIPYAP